MANYIDGYLLPVPRKHLDEYRSAAEEVAKIWKEYGAISYFEYVCEDLKLEGTRSFAEIIDATQEEAIVFGWVGFESKEARDHANEKVPTDKRMIDLVAPLTDHLRLIFDASRMAYGGFEPLVLSGGN